MMKMHDIIIDGARYMCVDDERNTKLICKLIEDYSKEVLGTEPPIDLNSY